MSHSFTIILCYTKLTLFTLTLTIKC